MKNFINKYYEDSIKLKERFKMTEQKSWDYLTVLTELNVQIGHVYTIDNPSEIVEPYRNIVNLGDEVSDIFFQLILLMYYLDYDMSKIEYNSKEKDLDSFMIAFGQCSEALLEKYGLRFNKPRPGFNTTDEYVMYKINQMLSITYNYSIDKNLDIYKEYELMLIDANKFLDRYKNKIDA